MHGPFLAQARLLGELTCPRLDGLEQVLGCELALERVGVCVDIAQNALASLEQLGDPGDWIFEILVARAEPGCAPTIDGVVGTDLVLGACNVEWVGEDGPFEQPEAFVLEASGKLGG